MSGDIEWDEHYDGHDGPNRNADCEKCNPLKPLPLWTTPKPGMKRRDKRER